MAQLRLASSMWADTAHRPWSAKALASACSRHVGVTQRSGCKTEAVEAAAMRQRSVRYDQGQQIGNDQIPWLHRNAEASLAHCRRQPDHSRAAVTPTDIPARPGNSHDGGTRTIWAFDVQGNKGVNGRDFFHHTVDGVKCSPDGLRADVFGNLWCSASGPLGYAGIFVYNPQGKIIGRIRLPEVCANLCFGGPKRNRRASRFTYCR
jgi:hypothetical protein